MARINLSQLKSKIRQIEQKQRQAINKYNQEVRRYNQNVKLVVNNINREIRVYNTKTHNNRQRIINEFNKLKSQSKTTQYTVLHSSVYTLHAFYEKLELKSKKSNLSDIQNHLYNLSEKEDINNLRVMNSLFSKSNSNINITNILQNSEVIEELNKISPELEARYHGAVFSLNPENPDAARHFCTSTREIMTKIININAPDDDVFSLYPNCKKTADGRPARRTKIKFILNNNNITDLELEDFVNSDITNIIELFKVFNEGTHGCAGAFSYNQLLSLKTRVEDGILFLTELIKK